MCVHMSPFLESSAVGGVVLVVFDEWSVVRAVRIAPGSGVT